MLLKKMILFLMLFCLALFAGNRISSAPQSTPTIETPNSREESIPPKQPFFFDIPFPFLYDQESGIIQQQVTIYSAKKLDAPITIGHITDLHFNYCNAEDFAENDPVIMSTYQNRDFFRNGSSRKNAIKCLAHTANFDQTVITGDVLDYLSHGTVQLLHQLIWVPYPETIITLGNHEYCRKMQGDIPEQLTIEERYAMLEQIWAPHHDPLYSSKLLGDAVLIIQMNNGLNQYDRRIVPQLQRDLQIARNNGYIVLLFQHMPLWSNNPQEEALAARFSNGYDFINLYTAGLGYQEEPNSPTEMVYRMITHNSDLIKGIFCGHEHGFFLSSIQCPDGSVIPQFIQTAACYNKGHVLRINVI